MNACLKLTQALLERARSDLLRPHPFAAERVGFVTCRFGSTWRGDLIVLAHAYYAVADSDYIDDDSCGAVINSNAFRVAMQFAYQQGVGVFHVHLHSHLGPPEPSQIDLRETHVFVPDFFNVQPKLYHGALILSLDSMSGRIWSPHDAVVRRISRFACVGTPMTWLSGYDG